jgi:ketosteroid isomerase-like protein
MKTNFNLNSCINHILQKTLFLMALSIFLVCSCKKSPMTFTKVKMKAIVEKQNEALGICFTTGDADKLAEMYTDSAKLSPNGSRFIIGRDSIKSFWKEDFKSSKVLKMETLVLTINGDENYIYETGKAFSEILYNDSVYHARVKYINVWRKQPNGDYKLDVDFWNKDMP